jgi:hypothetical protein
LDGTQNILWWPIDRLEDVHTWMFNRYVSKTHVLRTGLKPGEYHGVEDRVLHGLFTELVDFIEIEKAWHHCACDKEARKKYGSPWTFRRFRMSEWRCPEAGLAHLEWERHLKYDEEMGVQPGSPEYGTPTGQALGAQELLRLYNWWKTDRPARSDPYEESGWSDLCARKREGKDDIMEMLNSDNETPEERVEKRLSLDTLHELEEKYDEEDTAMLTTVIRIRKSMWT